MIIKINGEPEEIAENSTISELIEAKKLIAANIVVAVNDEIIEKSEYPTITLNNEDKLEIMSFVGGG